MISDKLVKTLIDFTLGDGSITVGKQFKLEHSIKQLDYLMHKVDRLQALGIKGAHSTRNVIISGKTYQTVAWITKVYDAVVTAKKWTYNSGRKAIDKALLRQLDDESLAYWFMDDGSAPRTYKSVSLANGTRYVYVYEQPKIERYTLSTYNCTLNELNLIIDWFKERYSLEPKIKLDKRSKTCYGGFLSISGVKEKEMFRNIIDPYVIPSMRYKVDGLHSFVGVPIMSVNKIAVND